MNITEIVTNDFVAAFRTDEDCTGVMAMLCAKFYPEGLPVGVDPNDERVRQVIARIQRVQGLGGDA